MPFKRMAEGLLTVERKKGKKVPFKRMAEGLLTVERKKGKKVPLSEEDGRRTLDG